MDKAVCKTFEPASPDACQARGQEAALPQTGTELGAAGSPSLAEFASAPPARLCLLLAGRAGAGKDTVAAILKEEALGRPASEQWFPMGFAEPLKVMAHDILCSLFPHAEIKEAMFHDRELKEKAIVDPTSGAPLEFMDGELTPRKFLQFLGTDVCRKSLGTGVWVAALIQRAKACPGHVVVTDARFPDELDSASEAFTAAGFTCVRSVLVDRPGSVAGTVSAAHASETALQNYANYNAILRNHGDLGSLRHRLAQTLKEIGMVL